MAKSKSHYYIDQAIEYSKTMCRTYSHYTCKVLHDNIHQNNSKTLYIETLVSIILEHRYRKSSYCNSSYRNINIENIEPSNHVKPIRLKFLIEPALKHIQVTAIHQCCTMLLLIMMDRVIQKSLGFVPPTCKGA